MIKISDIEKKKQQNSRLRIYFGQYLWNTSIFLDNQPILVREIKISALQNEVFPHIEVVLTQTDERLSPAVNASIEETIAALKSIPYVTVVLRPLEDSPTIVDKEETEPVWSSSEEDFQKSLDMVKNGKES